MVRSIVFLLGAEIEACVAFCWAQDGGRCVGRAQNLYDDVICLIILAKLNCTYYFAKGGFAMLDDADGSLDALEAVTGRQPTEPSVKDVAAVEAVALAYVSWRQLLLRQVGCCKDP